ncbi:MAG: fumarylacetoacetate hydrolase family protein, partial [Gemmatimonadales bacterium]
MRLDSWALRSNVTIIFQRPHRVSYISRYITFRPGDVNFSGTVGWVPDSRRVMQAGGVVEVEDERLGVLPNRIVPMGAPPDRLSRPRRFASVPVERSGSMNSSRALGIGIFVGVAGLAGLAVVTTVERSRAPAAAALGSGVPAFEVDPYWPKPLPNNWIIGQVSGVAVDSRDHVWIVHRQGSLTEREAGAVQDPPISECCVPAPSVIEFDPDGNVVQAWGGAGSEEQWPQSEHGIFVDHESNVWIGSDSRNDNVVLKFSSGGERLLQIGRFGETGGSNDTRLLGRPADVTVDPEANEVYIADGYGNRRIIVFDATTGEYKRHWGAYGDPPDDAELGDYDPDAPAARSFRSPVEAVRLSRDGLVYAAD